MIFTDEQELIINSDDDKIIVHAKAGTGKTSTLRAYAKKNFHLKILYLVFNKDLRKNFKDKFPINVDVHTFNSFAYSFYKKNIKESYDVFDIKSVLKCSIEDAFLILNQLKIYLTTGKGYTKDVQKFCEYVLNNDYIWDQDFLLRFFVLDLSKANYDCIMVDEAQDINPIILEIIEKINPKKIIFVGDSNQAIYGFNNALNIFEHYSDYSHYELSKTFRFGNEISDFIYSKMNILIQPNQDIDSKIVTHHILGPESYYICRTNAHLFDKALEYAMMGYKVAIPFDWDELEESLTSLFYLKIGLNKNINKKIRPFNTYQEFEKIVKKNFSVDMIYLYKIIEKYNIHILEYLKLIKLRLATPKYADISLITAHKAKGLEFMYVELAPDFKFHNQEEKNLYYVAATRAILELKT